MQLPPDRTDQLATRSRDFSAFETQANIEQANAFDKQAARLSFLYDFAIRVAPWWGGRLRKLLPYIRGPRVLEVSFGTGYLMSCYAGDYQVTGVDYNMFMLERTRRNLARRGLRATLVRGDAQRLPLPDDSFDCVINTDAFSLYPDSQAAMAEFHRVLAPGGRLLLMESNYPKDHNRLGMWLMALPRMLHMPLRDIDALLNGVGFSYEDVSLGMAGVLHLYVAEKAGAGAG